MRSERGRGNVQVVSQPSSQHGCPDEANVFKIKTIHKRKVLLIWSEVGFNFCIERHGNNLQSKKCNY